MRLSRKSEYALLALIELGENYDKQLVKIIDICNKRTIPKKYLEQILILLKGSGYVKSVRGASGGYKLAKKPEDINIAEIVRLIDGPIAPVFSASVHFFEHTPIEQNPKLLKLLKDIRKYIATKLEKTSIKDLI